LTPAKSAEQRALRFERSGRRFESVRAHFPDNGTMKIHQLSVDQHGNMTGGTSGLGAVAAKIILRSKNLRLLLGSRGGIISGAETVPVDLASLKSVRHFSEEVIRRLEGSFIDVLILNAGVNLPTRWCEFAHRREAHD
jgi:hypothetical protein